MCPVARTPGFGHCWSLQLSVTRLPNCGGMVCWGKVGQLVEAPILLLPVVSVMSHG